MVLSHTKYTIEIDENHDGQRIDNYLISYYKGVPKSRIYKAIRKGEVRINKKRIKQTDRIHQGDFVRVPPLKTAENKLVILDKNKLDLSWLDAAILYEDEGLMAINKPAGLAVHGGSGVKASLVDYLKVIRPNQYLKLVHRLDKATSGCILIAKNRQALLDLQQLFKDKKVQKHYVALAVGQMKKGECTVRSYLSKVRHGESGVKIIETADGKLAISHIRIREIGRTLTLLDVKIETGRMHQIRVHCQSKKVPILGDEKYGNHQINGLATKSKFTGMHLHCSQMSFPYKGQLLTVKAQNPLWVTNFKEMDHALTTCLNK